MTGYDDLTDLQRAAHEADDAARAAHLKLAAAVANALDVHNLPAVDVGRALCLSRQRVYQLRDAGRDYGAA